MAAVQSIEKPKTQRITDKRFFDKGYPKVLESSRTSEIENNRAWTMENSRLQELNNGEEEEKDKEVLGEEESSNDRPEALKIAHAVMSGGKNPIEELRKPPKVPYEHLAKDGVILYNGVCFVCDPKTNSICLGDMTDKKNVLNIPLSGGGHLKVNRANIGDLSKAAGMFSSEDLNLIMRAIALDTKLQATEEEIEDTKASVGNRLGNDNNETET